MKKVLLKLIFVILIYSCSSTKIGNDKTKYFDDNNIEISKSKFNQIRSTKKLLDIPGDSVNHKKLTLRENRGKVNDRKALELLLEKGLNQELDSNKPVKEKWPCAISEFNKVGKETYRMLEKTAKYVLRALAIYLELDEYYFDNYIHNGNSILRPIHYPPIKEAPKNARQFSK